MNRHNITAAAQRAWRVIRTLPWWFVPVLLLTAYRVWIGEWSAAAFGAVLIVWAYLDVRLDAIDRRLDRLERGVNTHRRASLGQPDRV